MQTESHCYQFGCQVAILLAPSQPWTTPSLSHDGISVEVQLWSTCQTELVSKTASSIALYCRIIIIHIMGDRQFTAVCDWFSMQVISHVSPWPWFLRPKSKSLALWPKSLTLTVVLGLRSQVKVCTGWVACGPGLEIEYSKRATPGSVAYRPGRTAGEIIREICA